MEIKGNLVTLKQIKPEEKDEFRKLVTQSYASIFWYGEKGDDRSRDEFFKYWHQGFFNQNDPYNGQCFWIIVNGKKIGEINYNEIKMKDKKVEIDILIGDKENHGKGYGSDAIRILITYLFNTFDLNKIWCEVRAFNTASIHTFEKVGFKKEGVLREETYFNDQFMDCIRLSILRRELKELSLK